MVTVLTVTPICAFCCPTFLKAQSAELRERSYAIYPWGSEMAALRFFSKLGALVLAGGAALLGVATVAAADDTPPPIEEDYDYPGADKIFAERGILLKKGDGHILLTDCVPGGDFLEVRSRNRDPFCFRVTGSSGYLTMELSDAYLVFSDSSHTTVANYVVNGVPGSTTVVPDGVEGIGEGSNPAGSPVLLEIRVTS